MKEIKLLKLSLNRFQGGTIDIDFEGVDANIFAANGQGKTRLVSAAHWLLFSRDALWRAEFSIKDLNAQGDVAERGVDHSVEGVFSIDGETVSLKKIFREKFAKARGRAEAEFSGHETRYFINSIPKSEREYKEFITQIAGSEDHFRLLTSPTAFPSLPWQKQRSILLDVVGDLRTEDVIDSNPKLIPLTELLKQYKSSKDPFGDMRKVTSDRRAAINKELPQIGIRIDECRRGMPDVTGLDREDSESEVKRLETALNDAKLRLQGVHSDTQVSSLMARHARVTLDIREQEKKHREGDMSTLNRLNQRVSEIEAQLSTSRAQVKRQEGEISGKEKQGQRLDASLVELRDKWGVIDAETFQDTTILACAACGQALPAERVSAAREKALGRFNEDKAERLKAVIEKGAALKEEKQRLAGEVEAIRNEKGILEEKIPRYEADLKQTTEDRDLLKRNSEDFSGIQGRAELLDELEDIEDQVRAEKEGKAQDVEKIKSEIDELNVSLVTAKEVADRFVRRERGEKRIEELKADEKKLSTEFEKLEGELYLIDLFIKTKVSLLTSKINEKFQTVRFKLFNTLVNGGLEECCEITVNGVPFNSGLNNAARINAGLEIVKVLQQHYGLKAPVFVDNAEAVNTLVDVGCQMIRLYVSDDKALRIEVGSQKQAPRKQESLFSSRVAA